MADLPKTVVSKAEVEKYEGKFQPLYDRQDIDEAFYFLENFAMTNLEDGQPTPNVQNVTLPDPANIAHKCIAILSGAEQSIIASGKGISEEELSKLEMFGEDILRAADDRLTNMGEAPLFPTQCERAPIRGRIGARVAIYTGKDGFVADVAPWDMRNVSYRTAPDGLLWASNKITKSREAVIDEHGFDPKVEDALIRNVLDRRNEYIMVEEEIAKTNPHNLGYVPVAIALTAGGSTLKTGDFFARQGESIFSMARGLFPQMNLVATILQTLNLMQFKAPMQYESEAGERARLPKKSPYGVGHVLAVEKGGGYKKMPIEDIINATRMIWSILDSRLQRSSFSSADYGTLQFPLSALAITKLTGEKEEMTLPSIQAIATFYQRLLWMAVDQFVRGALKAELGDATRKTLWTPNDLNPNAIFKFAYTAQSPEQNIANYSVAAAAGDTVDDEYKRKEILHVKDPAAMEKRLEAEKAEKLVPELRLYKMAKALFRKAKEGDPDAKIQAILIANRLKISLEELEAAAAAMAVPKGQVAGIEHGELKKPRSSGQQLVPLTNEGARMPSGQTPEKESAQLAVGAGTEVAG